MQLIGYVKSKSLVVLLLGAFARISPIRINSNYQPVYGTHKHFPLTAGVVDVINEQHHAQEKWGPVHDGLYTTELSAAAMCEVQASAGCSVHKSWPFEKFAPFKYRSRREHLVRAAAFLISEIDKHDREEKARKLKG